MKGRTPHYAQAWLGTNSPRDPHSLFPWRPESEDGGVGAVGARV